MIDAFKPVRQMPLSGQLAWSVLQQVAKRDELNTQVVRVEKLADVLLAPTGVTVAEGLSYNLHAVKQLCGLIAPHYWSAIEHMIDHTEAEPEFVKQRVIRILNNAFALAEKQLLRQRMVVDTAGKVIVGFVGVGYKFVSTGTLIETMTSRMRHPGNSLQFDRGRILNRTVWFFLRRAAPVVTWKSVAFYEGLVFVNSETSDRAVFLGRVLFDSFTSEYSVEASFVENRLVHRASRSFSQRLDQVVTRATRIFFPPEQIATSAAEAAKRILWHVGGSPEAKSRMGGLVKTFRQKGLPHWAIVSVQDRLCSINRPVHMMDVYFALLQAAKQYGELNLKLRQCAFSVLKLESRDGKRG